MAITHWHIDAWAVRDGAAFASRRESNSRLAENTVFIAVPDLEPVPVGRMSTALSATRRSFQAGLWNNNHVEIPFENLEQISELVRRGFLAGGLGPDGSGAPIRGGGRPPPRIGGEARVTPNEGGPSPSGAEHFERAVSRTHTEEWRWHERQTPVRESLELIAIASEKPTHDSAASEMIPPLLELVASFAESITIDWEWRVKQSADPLDTKMLIEWYRALVEIDVWARGNAMIHFLKAHECAIGEQVVFNWRPTWTTTTVGDAAMLSRQHLLSYAPCPRRSRWAPRLVRLADKMTLPMCVGDYFAPPNCCLPELAPSILGAMLLTSRRFPSSSIVGTQFRHLRLAAAIRWLAQEVPRSRMPSEAEILLNNYAWQQVDSPPSGTSASV